MTEGTRHHGVHTTVQTGFRIPAGVLASAKAAAARGKVTLTAFVISAIEEKLARDGAGITTTATGRDGITTRARKPRTAATTPAAKAGPESASDIMAALRRRRTGGQ
jgi:hypothetical protein